MECYWVVDKRKKQVQKIGQVQILECSSTFSSVKASLMAECRVELEGYCKVTQQKERALRMVKNKGLSGSLCLTKTDSSGYLKVFLLEKYYKIVLWAYMAFFHLWSKETGNSSSSSHLEVRCIKCLRNLSVSRRTTVIEIIGINEVQDLVLKEDWHILCGH